MDCRRGFTSIRSRVRIETKASFAPRKGIAGVNYFTNRPETSAMLFR
jgi:hypothetical protein